MHINLNIRVLEQLIDLLQSCFSVAEVSKTIEPLVQRLFPHEAGAIYVMTSSNSLLEAIATWGPAPLTSDPIFTPNECLALQRGQSYLADDTHHCLLCQHIRTNVLPVETFCVPMMAHGETVGVLSVSSLKRGQISETRHLAEKVAKHLGLALANLKLRETLKNQSLRDPLTKLYNRSYLEESLEREIRKAERRPQPLGIILLHIDRFGSLQQRFGQAASDFLLREIGLFLPTQIRSSDIACRYSGEEFLLLLPEAPLSVTQQRAEQVRQGIKQLNLQYRGKPLGPITISGGVANFNFSEHRLSAKEAIQIAHTALNHAQEVGGDRIVTGC
ncbi:MAG TPA: GGDEF domain-containing protein [Cyanobacteria bacterium UBA12227]|nr:GGDEF domain-containing protein [Cyanobacteria bacterium UBA12227]HAX85618.1 GGDEF domain-containing protein [Cyanobacteria bacterium UBA11370]